MQILYGELSQKSLLICQLREFQKGMLTRCWTEIWNAHIQLLAWLYRWTTAIPDLSFPGMVPQFPHSDTGDDVTV